METADDWFCEAVWAEGYASGGFDQTDVVAGSGGRLRDGMVTFVSSCSTVDRLCSLERAREVWVSNSLACLMAEVGAALDETYPRYYEDLYTIVHGLARYKRSVNTTGGSVQLTYFENLRWDGTRLEVVDKPAMTRDFSSFGRYRDFLASTMELMAENARARERRRPYALLGTLSTGYDSPTVASLARSAGCKEVICFDRARGGEDDSGERIAEFLGLRPIRISGSAWRSMISPEIPFLASNGMGEEVRYRGAEARLAGCMLMTGYHGDKVWDARTKDLSADVVRGDPSGSSLMEYRLWAEFIHCPVPFWGVRQIRDVNAISRSREMHSWDVGQDYSRPICRRIVEEAGVPRDAFGVRKLAASTMLYWYDDFLTPGSMEAYMLWLRSRRTAWWRQRRIPPLVSASLDRAVKRAADVVAEWSKRKPGVWRWAGRLEGPLYLRRYVFPWAIEQAKARYGRALDEVGSRRAVRQE